MTTTTKLNKNQVLADVSAMRLGNSLLAAANLDDDLDDAPTVANKGGGSVHVLRRRQGTGWRYIGYATWSCRDQSYVCGSLRHPATADEAHKSLEDMAWEG